MEGNKKYFSNEIVTGWNLIVVNQIVSYSTSGSMLSPLSLNLF